MLDKVERLLSGKGVSWFLLGLSIFFAVFDLATGNVVFGVLMAVLAVYWARNTYTIYKGTNKSYNRTHGIH